MRHQRRGRNDGDVAAGFALAFPLSLPLATAPTCGVTIASGLASLPACLPPFFSLCGTLCCSFRAEDGIVSTAAIAVAAAVTVCTALGLPGIGSGHHVRPVAAHTTTVRRRSARVCVCVCVWASVSSMVGGHHVPQLIQRRGHLRRQLSIHRRHRIRPFLRCPGLRLGAACERVAAATAASTTPAAATTTGAGQRPQHAAGAATNLRCQRSPSTATTAGTTGIDVGITRGDHVRAAGGGEVAWQATLVYPPVHQLALVPRARGRGHSAGTVTALQ